METLLFSYNKELVLIFFSKDVTISLKVQLIYFLLLCELNQLPVSGGGGQLTPVHPDTYPPSTGHSQPASHHCLNWLVIDDSISVRLRSASGLQLFHHKSQHTSVTIS